MTASFIFYLAAARASVFAQQLRFLAARERLDTWEAVVVWHGPPGVADLSAFAAAAELSVGGPYNKAALVNAGVRAAVGDVVAILDADRVLPPGYFGRARGVEPGVAAAPRRMVKAMAPASDGDVAAGRLPSRRDDRTADPVPFRKGLFSGNTVVRRADYWAAGGMDTRYVGYGFNDTDAARAWAAAGFRVWWTEAEEIHLYHERDDDADPTGFHAQNAANAVRYARKWGGPAAGDPTAAARAVPWC